MRRHSQDVAPMVGIRDDGVGRRIRELSRWSPVRWSGRRSGWSFGIAEIVVSDEVAVEAGVTGLRTEREIGAIHDRKIPCVADQVRVGVFVDPNRMPLAGIVPATGNVFPEFIPIHVNRQANLTEIIDAGNALGFFLRARQGRQQHRRQDCDDGDDHEQFNERKGALPEAMRWRGGFGHESN